MKYITCKAVLNQLRWDLIGKDSQRGISLTYGWLCNQWGHFGLGFFPAILMGAYGNMHWFGLQNIVIAGLLISVISTVFEIFNFTYPHLSKKSEMTFEPAWGNVAFDTFTDLVFFYIGGLSAIQVLSCLTSEPVANGYFYALIGGFIYVAAIFTYWYTTKMYLQSSGFPFQFRLSQWMKHINENYKNVIIDIIKHEKKSHILIFGGESTGKTSLAVSIATEFAIKHNPAFYTTAIKWSDMLLKKDDVLNEKNNTLWSWRQSKCLVIDDINPGTPIPDVMKPDFFNNLFNSALKDINIEAMQNKTTIWVVGNPENETDWINQLIKFGINKNDIVSIKL